MKFNWIHVLSVIVVIYSLWCTQSCRSGYDKPLNQAKKVSKRKSGKKIKA